jgi:hypothetical protein
MDRLLSFNSVHLQNTVQCNSYNCIFVQAVSYILHTMDPSNLIMRKACIISSMMALREIARVFPMVALNDSMTRLAVGDAIGEIHNATICVYDIERYMASNILKIIFHIIFSILKMSQCYRMVTWS